MHVNSCAANYVALLSPPLPQDVQHFLLPWTKQYLAVFSAILASYDKISSAAEFGLVREILSVLTKLLSAFNSRRRGTH